MANVAHSSLTGADLHESKGTAAAAASTAFIADGAGSGSYQKVPAAALAALANPFAAQLLHVREEQTQGTNSTTAVTNLSWIATVLNTVKTNEIAGASLASNQITLPAGTYYLDSLTAWYQTASGATNGLKPRLFNFTTSAVIMYGAYSSYGLTGAAGNATCVTPLRGRFTLAGTSALILQQYKQNGVSPLAFSQGTEVYSEAMIWRIA